MNKSLYIVAFSLAFATTGIAQNNEGQDKTVDLGTQTTTELRKTQAVSTIYSDELDKNATTSPYNAIYGLLPGLTVMQNTSWGTDKSRLNVRGRGSLNGDTPLFVVDGFARPIEYINLSEIESISVLKDGAATALWGGRGANGVVLITTKRGMYSKKEIKVDYKFGLGLPVNQPEFADAYTYAKARNEALMMACNRIWMKLLFWPEVIAIFIRMLIGRRKRCVIIRPVINWILLSAGEVRGCAISVS